MKGWLDNFGKADNANNSNVSMSEDFVGLGYNTKGRNYSPAWGGQFQKGGNLFMQQTMDVVQPPATVPYLRTKDPAEFYKAWIQNPEYARRQLLTGYSSGEDLYMPNAAASRESRLGALEEMTPITYSTRQPSKASPGVYGSPSYVNINPLDYIDTSKEAIEAHELAHIAGAMGEVRPGMMSAKEQEIFKKSMLPMKEPVLSGVQGSKEREASKRALEDWKHSQEPDEAKADLDALRFMMYDKGIYDITKGKKFTEADFEKAKQSLGKDRVFKRLTDRVGKKNFVNLMNVIAKGDEDLTPIAMNGASMPGAVGFTYARVAGAAPSKGKYAKKTMASAQNGIIADKIAGLELKMSPEYQRLKYLQSLPQLRQAPGRGEELIREGLATADIATDLMQVGNFIPHPMAQGVGKAGNILGSGVDLAQALMSARQGDYLDAAINLGSVGLAGGLASSTFRRNSKYLQPGQPLYALSPQAFGSLSRTNYIEPFRKVGKMTDKNLLANRALLGLIGAETVYDAIPQKEYGGEIPSAQNGEEDIKTIDLPEIVVTPYDEQYPFYQSLSNEQKKYINDQGPIGRATRALATTGKKGQTAKDISNVVRDVEKFGYEATGVPGTIRFSADPVKNLKGAGKTLLDLGVAGSAGAFAPSMYGALGGYNPITNEKLFNQQNLQGAFNTLDTFGLASAMAAPIAKPIGVAVGKAVIPHITSVSNVANETLDAIQAINRAKQLEKLSIADVPALPGIDKVKDVRNFGKELAELESKSRNASLNDLNSLREKFTKLSAQAKEIESLGITNARSSLNSIEDKLKSLSDFKLDDFVNSMQSQGANQLAVESLRNNPDLALRYYNTISSFDERRLAEELFTGDVLSALENFRTYPGLGKSTNFSPNYTNISNIGTDPTTGNLLLAKPEMLKKVGNKLYENTWGSDEFYSYPFYKNIGDKIVDKYSNLKLSGSPIIPQVQNYSEAIELMPSLFADRYNVGSMLRQVSRFIDETPDGLMYPANSLSGDSYPLSLNMMARELKNNPDSKLRLIGFDRSNNLGFADKLDNPQLLRSELSQIVKDLENISGQTLPKPYVYESTYGGKDVVLPKFAISKGSTNKAIEDYLSNTSMADRLGVKRPVYESVPNPARNISNPPQTIYFDPDDIDFKNGGIVKDNQGYWNPDNWGKPVEIGSNNITMEGVYEPLLGISDTGDTKLMQPGKNYKFKGKKVTEFPVAQTGINWLEKEKDARTYLSNWLAKREKQLGENMGTTNPRMIRQELGNQLQNIYDTPISYDPLDYADNSVGIPKLREKIEKEPDLKKRNKMYDELESLNKKKDLAYDNLMIDFEHMGGSYSPYFNSIFVKDYLEPEEVESTILHELTHALNYPSGSMLNYNRPYTHNINPGKDIPQLEKIKKIVNENRDSYYDKPTEIYSRLMEFRKKNKLNPSKTYTIDDIKDLRDRTENWFFDKAQDYNLFERYTDDQILKLINDVASGKKQKMPVGKLGINQLDAQPMKKLNQLLNFTNNPDKDNWLDKYN